MAKTIKGSTVSYDSGKFKLIVSNIDITSNEIKFTPYVKVTDAFRSKHDATITWKDANNTKKTLTKSGLKANGNYFSTSKVRSNKDESVTITATIGGKKSTVTINASTKPKTPTITVAITNDYHFEVNVTRHGNKTTPTTSVYLEKKADAESASWEEIKTWSGTTYGDFKHTYIDQSVERGHRYRYRVRSHNVNGYSDYVYYPSASKWTYTYPPDISDVSHERLDNSRCRILWNKSGQEVDRALITGYEIWASESGGTFRRVATVPAGAATDETMEYIYSGCQPDNYYRFIVRPYNSQGTSLISYPSEYGTDATYNTPAAPIKITGTATRQGYVKLTLVNTAKTADVLQIARYEDSEWTQYEDISESEEVVTEWTDTTGITGTGVKYRARNGRTDMELASERYSSWTESNEIDLLSKPAVPTIIQPIDNTPYTLDNGTLKFSWIHNPTDGTAQTAYELKIYKNGTLVRDYTMPVSDQYFVYDISTWSPNDILTWQIATRGSYTTFSDFSELHTVYLYGRPEIAFTAPVNGAVIDNLPVSLGFDYTDNSGILSKLTLDIIKDGDVKYTESLDVGEGLSGSYSYELRDYLFDNDASYTLKVTALSSTGLQTTDEIGIDIAYVPVELRDSFLIDTTTDDETGYVTLTFTLPELNDIPDDPDEDMPQPVVVNSPVESAYLYRINRGERVFLTTVSEGDQYEDRYAPLNTDYTYELLEIAESGQIAIVTVECEIVSQYFYVYYGNGSIARAIYNPAANISLSRPEKQQIRYSGRKYPVSYDSLAMAEGNSFSATITDREELQLFIDMMRQGGRGVWKGATGEVYAADFELNYTSEHGKWYDIDLNVERIESEDL